MIDYWIKLLAIDGANSKKAVRTDLEEIKEGKAITYNDLKAIANPGDILIGRFVNPMMNYIQPIILIGECVGCVVDKPDVEAGITHYLRKEGNIYIRYKVIKK